MKQEYSLAYLTVCGCPPPEMIHAAAMAGYDYVSLRTIPMGLAKEPVFDLAEDRDLFAKTKKALEATGLGLHDIELARILEGVDIGSYEPAIRAAAELGCRHLLSSIWSQDRGFYIGKFAELCDLADRHGMTVDLEFVPIACVRDIAQTVEVLRSVDRKNAGIMIDVHHFHRAREKVGHLAGLPREWFRFAHLCDAPAEIPADIDELRRIMREDRSYVGEGGIDVAGIMHALPPLVYSIELPNLAKVREFGQAEHARRCLQSAKAYFEQHPRDDS